MNLVNITGSITVSGAIGGNAALTLTNRAGSTWTFTGVNTYTNTTSISNLSTLTIGGAGKLNSGSYAARITNNGTFNYASSTAAQTLSAGDLRRRVCSTKTVPMR